MSTLSVKLAIARAESMLPGNSAPDGKRDPRWQAIIRVGEFVESQPELVWQFAERWGKHPQADLRMAIATCLLEHLLEHHFQLLFDRVRKVALESARFADTFESCAVFGQASNPKNTARIEELKQELARKHKSKRRG